MGNPNCILLPLKLKYRAHKMARPFNKKGGTAGKSQKGTPPRPRRKTYGPWFIGETLHERSS